MAGVDKIYLNKEQAKLFVWWLVEHKSDIETQTGRNPFDSMYDYHEGGYLIFNFPSSVDWYLWDNCQLDFIQEKIRDQYGGDRPENELDTTISMLEDIMGGDNARTFILHELDADLSLEIGIIKHFDEGDYVKPDVLKKLDEWEFRHSLRTRYNDTRGE